MRIVQVARAAELFLRDAEQPPLARLRERAGGAYDPALVEACAAHIDELVAIARNTSPCGGAISRLPPGEHPSTTLEQISLTFADYADLKSIYRVGHSHAVAALATAAGQLLDLEEVELEQLRYAGLLHDIGMVTVPTGILESQQPLSFMEHEKIRLHPYYTNRVLSLSPLASIARVAGGHHERADSSGYPGGLPGSAIPLMTRILSAADVYRALLERRPRRAALDSDAAARVMDEEVTAGRLDRAAAGAVLRAAGHTRARSEEPPSLLTGREISVLRCVAVGQSDKEIAADLGISPRTVHHHVARVYRKIGVSSRAAAALYAVENGLLPLA
jgi:HD-GYP domain-containing protein (c-di-GMP phosphodiesterase class II)